MPPGAAAKNLRTGPESLDDTGTVVGLVLDDKAFGGSARAVALPLSAAAR